jgi:hypothetical protein
MGRGSGRERAARAQGVPEVGERRPGPLRAPILKVDAGGREAGGERCGERAPGPGRAGAF